MIVHLLKNLVTMHVKKIEDEHALGVLINDYISFIKK